MKIILDHIGIAVNDLDSGSEFWRLLGLVQGEDEILNQQGVKVRFFETDAPESDGHTPRLELLEPLSEDTPIGKFLNSRGRGVQQVAFRVDDLEKLLNYLNSSGIRLIDQTPRPGAGGTKIAFVHPSSTGGVLVELLEYQISE
jgi:methylmalonyl-CoA/ethylmalonyl-CoA epimerase